MPDRIEPLTSGSGAPAPPCAGSTSPADLFRLLFDNHPAPVWAFDEATLRFVAVNDAVLRRFGYTRARLLELTVRDVCPPEDADRLAAAPAGPVAWRHRVASGAVVAVEVTTRRLSDAGRALRLVVAGDATERRKAEGALKERDELLRDVLTHVPCAVFWKDRASIYIGCNDQAARDRGLTVPGEVIGQTDYDLARVPEEAERDRAGDRTVIETATPLLDVEETHTLENGKKATFLTNRVPLRDSSGAVIGVVGVSQNVTDRKRLEDELRHAQKMEAVGRLAGGVAHDFNNLLTVVTGSIHLIRSLPPGDPGVGGYVDDIQDAVDRAATLTRQLLTFSRKQPSRPETLDLNDVVNGLAGLLRRLIGNRIKVQTELADEPVRVRADRGHLEQVLMNLAVNVRDAMPTGGTLTVATAVEPARKLAKLTVTDTGCGMSDDVKAKIFEPFFTTKEIGKGTGLGLATVHGIVVQAGGGIEVVSAPGAGTAFDISLPRCDAPPILTTPAPAPFATAAGRSVLLVEDEERIRTQVRAMLESWGYAVTTAAGADAALALLTPDRTVDLLVTDMVMPGTDGSELATRVRAERPGVAVVFMSGFVPDARRLGAFADAVFLPKPFAPLDLIRCAERALRQRGAPVLQGGAMTRRVLIATDDPDTLRALRDAFAALAGEWDATFARGPEAPARLNDPAYDALVADAHLPADGCAELLAEARRRHPQTARIVFASPGRMEVVKLVALAHRVLSKAGHPDELLGAIERAGSLRELLGSRSLAALVGRLTSVPALSAVYARIAEELAFSDYSLAAVGSLVAQDVGISAKLLQMANSALVGLRKPAATPHQAVRILGADLTRTLVLAADLFSRYNPHALKPFSIEAVWEHSQAVAELAAAIATAERADERVVRECALSGLFHDIGRLTLASQLTGPYKEVLARMRGEHLSAVEAERAVLGTSHAEVGAYLLGLWGLPDGLVEAVAWHHNPGGCPGGGFTALTAVHAADALLLEPQGAMPDWPYLARLGLSDRFAAWRILAYERAAARAEHIKPGGSRG